MERKAESRTIVTLLAISMLTLAFNIPLVKAESSEPPIEIWHVHTQIRAITKLARHVFRGVGDIEDPYWQHIYVINPTRQAVDINSVQIDTYVNRVFHPEISYLLTPDWAPERWDTEILPFEKSLILYHGWAVGEDEPEGVYVFDITVYVTVMGEYIELKTRSTFRVFL